MNKKLKIGIVVGVVVVIVIGIIVAITVSTNNKNKEEETKIETTKKVDKKEEVKEAEETFIATEDIAVFEKADKESKILGTTKEGEKVVVVNKDENSFVKIKYNDGLGYIENTDNLMTEEEYNKKKEEEAKAAEEAKKQEESNGNQSNTNKTNTATNAQTVVQNTDPVPQPAPNYVSQPQPAYGSYRWDNPNATAGEWFHAHYTVTYEFRDDGYWHTTHIQPSGGFPGDLFQTASDVVYNSVAATPGTPGQNVTKTLFIYAGGEQIIPAQ